MKKTKINLLTSREDYGKYDKYFKKARWASLFFIFLFTISSAYFFFNLAIDSRKISDLLKEKQGLLQSLQNRQFDEAKLYYAANKYQGLTDYLKDDAYSYPYYKLLNTAIATSSESAILKSFDIDKNRNVNFVVSFENFDELMNFFRFVESEFFLNKFETVTLKNFNAIGNNDKISTNYELSFNARFIPIKIDIFSDEK